MPHMDISAAQAWLSQRLQSPRVPGAPPHELDRSPAAATTGALAAESGLFLAHFEYRREAGATDDEDTWDRGVLPEQKYQSFRHDLRIGGFHPGHRAKWTAHALSHGLVGFGWKDGANALWHATAGRIAELVPVVLWYFLDEVRLTRCPAHAARSGVAHCDACEQAAAPRPWGPTDDEALQGAKRFLDAELAAIAATRRTGRPVSHRWEHIDLTSDGLAYAAAHGRRLRSRRTAAWMETLTGPERATHLDDLLERALGVLRATATGAPLRPWAATPRHGRIRWIAQDLAARAGRVPKVLAEAAAASLGDGPLPPESALLAAIPPALHGVGYAIGGHDGRDRRRISRGLGTAFPTTLRAARRGGLDLVDAFVRADNFERLPLPERFARWAHRELGRTAADGVGWEADLALARRDPLATILGPGAGPVQLAEGSRVRVAHITGPPHHFAGSPPEAVDRRGAPCGGEPVGLLTGVDAGGNPVTLAIPPDLATALTRGPVPRAGLGEAVRLGLLVPVGWNLR